MSSAGTVLTSALLAIALTISLALNAILAWYVGGLREELERERGLPWKRQ